MRLAGKEEIKHLVFSKEKNFNKAIYQSGALRKV